MGRLPLMRRWQPSRRRIKARLLNGQWVDKYDLVRCALGPWLRRHVLDWHERREAGRLSLSVQKVRR